MHDDNQARLVFLNSIVDSIVGLQEETFENDGVQFHRDGEYFSPMMTEDYFRNTADALVNDKWYGINVSTLLQNGIDAATNILMRDSHITPEEMKAMRSQLLTRFAQRLQKYRNGRQLLFHDDGGDIVGFRWG